MDEKMFSATLNIEEMFRKNKMYKNNVTIVPQAFVELELLKATLQKLKFCLSESLFIGVHNRNKVLFKYLSNLPNYSSASM